MAMTSQISIVKFDQAEDTRHTLLISDISDSFSGHC